MQTTCASCGLTSTEAFGYCDNCGGVREIDSAWTSQAPASGLTPLYRSRIPGLEGLLLKYEGSNPSGSFKDRLMSVTLDRIAPTAPRGVVVPSSGNAALAAAAACAARHIPMIAMVPLGTSESRTTPIEIRGGAVIRAGRDPSQTYRLAGELAERLGLFALLSTFANPFSEWACRGVGGEIMQQTDDAPETLISPVSAGPILVGSGRGMTEHGATPRLVGVQAVGCSPIASAFDSAAETVTPWESAIRSRAGAIADPLTTYPQDGSHTLNRIRASGGIAAAVTDDQLWQARADLLTFDGLDVEMSGCAGVAWLQAHAQPPTDPTRTACVLTASGFKHTYVGEGPSNPMAEGTRTLHNEMVKALERGNG